MSAPTPSIALVTGGNRGLGLHIAQQLAAAGSQVFITARDPSAAQAAAEKLGSNAQGFSLEASKPRSLAALVASVAAALNGRKLNLVVNNAAINEPVWAEDTYAASFAANVAGPIQLTQLLTPHLAENAHVIMVSSGLGQLSWITDPAYVKRITEATTYAELADLPFNPNSSQATANFGGRPSGSYILTKAALNRAVQLFAEDETLRKHNISVIAVSPGWCRTDMGSAAAPRSADEGAASILWPALQNKPELNGTFLDDQGQFYEW